MFLKRVSVLAGILSTVSAVGVAQADVSRRHEPERRAERQQRVEQRNMRYERNRRQPDVEHRRPIWLPSRFTWTYRVVTPPPVVVRPSYAYTPPVYTPPVYTQPTYAPPTLTSSTAYGRPASLASAEASGYFIWLGSDGVWHLRGASAGAPAQFFGTISSPDGQIELVASSMGAVSKGADRLAFNVSTGGAQTGIDFRLAAGSTLRFDLRQNDIVPEILLGRAETPAPGGSFLVYQ